MSSGERRVCLLTGAGGQLGDEFCRRLYTEYDIVAVHRERVPSAPSQHEWFIDPFQPDGAVPENDSRVHLIKADLTEPGEVERVVDLALARFGRVDLLVNNAVHIPTHLHGLVDGDAALDDFDRTFRTNVGVPLRLSTRLAQRGWLHDHAGNQAWNRNIVNVSCIYGTEVFAGGQALHAASKAALNQLTRHLAAEFTEFGVRVNALTPNSFPGVVPVENVLRAIFELDNGAMTGGVFEVEIESGEPPAGRHALPA
ncbi:SDR family NAD(P)-dependent oxidoreductase [Nocardia sp. NPDC051832]|uniref:SDR family NAD(P)-dependent oxidoreductase n=1 Tax=Nocardia sp. NPDC051832 TaxID=3155673 RepID=UPI003418C785